MFEFIGGLNGDDYCPYSECDRYEPGEDGGYSNYYMRPPVRCNVCSSTNVYWKQVSGRWILFDKNFSSDKIVCHKCHIKRFNRALYSPPAEEYVAFVINDSAN